MPFQAFSLAASLLLVLLRVPAWAQTPADWIIRNAAVYTLDAKNSRGQAVAITGNRIAAVGAGAGIESFRGPRTRVIDAAGGMVLPGFNDSHVHFLSGGFQLASVDLRDAASPAEFARRIGEFARKLPRGQWVLGGDWDHELWPGAPLPTRALIDAVTPDTPVFVSRLDGHMALANTLALKTAGLTKETRDPEGGLIVRDPKTGEPTGILKDAAMGLVQRVIPPRSFEEKLAAARAATQHAASLGVTSVQDVSAGTDVSVYQALAQAGQLLTRVYAITPVARWEDLARTGIRAPFGSPLLRIGGLKGFADGSLGSTTALFFDSYNDAPGMTGLPGDDMLPEGIMLDRVRRADKVGLQVMLHAIGDKANHTILSIFEQVTRENGARDRRFRIEHAQHLRPRDVPRFAATKVIASMQPYHAADDGRWAEKRIGPERILHTYAFRSLLDAGTVLAFGSDWTVAPLDPLLGLKAAVTRETIDGKNPRGWVPGQKITLLEALKAYTQGSAYAEFQEAEKGSLEAGKLADVVLFSADLFALPPSQWNTVKVRATFMDGRLVYQR